MGLLSPGGKGERSGRGQCFLLQAMYRAGDTVKLTVCPALLRHTKRQLLHRKTHEPPTQAVKKRGEGRESRGPL